MSGLAGGQFPAPAGADRAIVRKASGALDRPLLRRSGARRDCEFLPARRDARPGVHGYRNGGFRAVRIERASDATCTSSRRNGDEQQNLKPTWHVATSCARSAPAPVSRWRPPPLVTEAKADSETDSEKRKARYKAESDRGEDLLQRQPLSELREAPVLIKRTERQARQAVARRPRQPNETASTAAASCAGPVSPPAVSPRSAPCRSPACARREAGPPAAKGAARHHPQEHLHALLGRLHRHRRSVERRLGRPGAELGIADQPRLALRQGRLGARTGHGRTPPEIPDEARERPVDPHQVGLRPSTRSATS